MKSLILCIKTIIVKLVYYINIKFLKTNCLEVYSIDETISKILNYNSSVIRFGDGEMEIIKGKSIGFQKYDVELANKLKDIMATNYDNLMICIPDVFGDLNKYTDEAKLFWQSHLFRNRRIWNKQFDISKKYYNTF